jgi:hypothetical protein
MKEKIYRNTALLISALFNPYFIPTFGFLIVLSYKSGLELYSSKLIGILLGIVFITSCILPVIFSMLMQFSTKKNQDNKINNERIIPSVFSAFSLFLGAQLMGKLPVPHVFQLFLLGSCLLLIALFLTTIKGKLSTHSASLGALLGTLLALTFKYGMNLQWSIIATILISGIVGSSRIYLKKKNPIQVYLGYTMGILIMYFTIYFF